MADSKSKIKKLKEAGPPPDETLNWRLSKSGQPSRLYREAVQDIAAIKGISEEEVEKNITEKNLTAWLQDAYGQYTPGQKKLELDPGEHETPQRYRATAAHEISHSLGQEHGAKIPTRSEAREYWRPTLMGSPETNIWTGEITGSDLGQQAANIIKTMKKMGVENAEEVYYNTLLENEEWGPQSPQHKKLTPDEQKSRIQKMRQRAYPEKK